MARRMWVLLVSILLATLASAGCASLEQDKRSAPTAGQSAAGQSAAPTRQTATGGDAGQTTQKRGEFELVGGQGRVFNGFVRISALVRNNSRDWAAVVINVELLDAGGKALVNRAATNAGEQMRSEYAIPPGKTLYYLYLRDVNRLSGAYVSHRLTLKQANGASAAGSAQVALTSQTPLKPAGEGAPTYSVLGTATTAAGCEEPLVVAAGFDAQGKLLDVTETPLYPTAGARGSGTSLNKLNAGTTGHFTADFVVPGVQSAQAVAVCR